MNKIIILALVSLTIIAYATGLPGRNGTVGDPHGRNGTLGGRNGTERNGGG